MRCISEQGRNLIARFEGFSPKPYLCPAGYLTIGYGHRVQAAESFPPEGIGAERAQALLESDLRAAQQAVARLIEVVLTDGQFAALVSFTFNLGAAALQRSGVRRKANRQEHEAVPHELMKWIWADGRKLAGLIHRRAAEAALYRC